MSIQIFEESDLADQRSGAIYEEAYVSSTREPRRTVSGWYQDGPHEGGKTAHQESIPLPWPILGIHLFPNTIFLDKDFDWLTWPSFPGINTR
jgi:hypothetical protein